MFSRLPRLQRVLVLAAAMGAAPCFAAEPFDTLVKAYGPFLRQDEPFGMAMKSHSLSVGEYEFWRGSKPLFYAWCKEHTADWMADKSAYTLCHGDIHPGNFGTYASGDKPGQLSFGLVDMDEATMLPFQLDILDNCISVESWRLQQGLDVSPGRTRKTLDTFISAYRSAMEGKTTVADVIQGKPAINILFKHAGRDYAREIKDLVVGSKFVATTKDKSDQLKEVFVPAADRKDAFAKAICEAAGRDTEFGSLLRLKTEAEFHAAILDIVLRCRVASSGSQGQPKYLVLMKHPLKDMDSDVVLYLKGEIHSAAEAGGLIQSDGRPNGQRVAEATRTLSDPKPYLCSWCKVGSESFWISMKEPWSDDYYAGALSDSDNATLVATVLAAAHKREGKPQEILARLTPELTEQLLSRTQEYVVRLQSDFAAFNKDPVPSKLIRQAEDYLTPLRK